MKSKFLNDKTCIIMYFFSIWILNLIWHLDFDIKKFFQITQNKK